MLRPTSIRPALSALAAALVTAGCSFIPTYERPAAPVAPAFAEPAASGVAPASTLAGTAADAIEWQKFFVDPRLKRLIEIALANNRDMRVAALNIEQLRAQYQIRRADILPTVNVAATGQRQTTAADTISSQYAVGLAVTAWELDLWGRVRSLSEAALAQYYGSEEARKATQISLVAAVASTYITMLADDEQLKVTRQTLATREDSFKLTQLKFDNGVASSLDLHQAESLLEGAKAALAQQVRLRAQDENALVLLLGQSPPADLPAGLSMYEQALQTDLPPGVPSEVLARRPDVRSAEQQLIAANANIGAARANFFPRISLTGSAGTVSNELSGLFKSGSFGWSFAPQVALPIFDSGRNFATLDAAKVNREIAVAQYEKSIQTAFREVSDALAGRATLTEQTRAQVAQAAAEKKRFDLTDLRYRNGASSYFEVLEAQRALFTAQQAAVLTQAAAVQNQIALYKVLGGGWTEPPPAQN
ncbi:efflux transporter outer membrane subunit [Sphaerotilaceae bacterium SBD11-9]